MNKNFQIEVGSIKRNYEDSVGLVTEASYNLTGLFKHKMLKIKNKMAKFFAEIDIRIAQNTKDVI